MPVDVVCEACGFETRILFEQYWIYRCPKCGGKYKPGGSGGAYGKLRAVFEEVGWGLTILHPPEVG